MGRKARHFAQTCASAHDRLDRCLGFPCNLNQTNPLHVLRGVTGEARLPQQARIQRVDTVKKERHDTNDSRQFESLRVFHDVARALVSTLELDALLHAILSQMEEFFGPEQWSLLMIEPETNQLYYALTSRMDGIDLSGIRINMGDGVAGRVAETGSALVVPDISKDPDWSAYAARHPELNLQSIASLPIRHGEQTLGVLQMHNSKLDLLPESSLSFLRVVCDYTAIALHNANQVKKIHQLSITDDCTGLFNGRYLYNQLEEEIARVTNPRVRPIHPYFSLLFLDLDYFKTVNDTHGHLIGSRLLAEIGGLLKRSLGPNHSGFRYGGDEFVAILRHLDKPAATEFALKLREDLLLERFLTAANLSIKITASYGLATFPEDGTTMHEIIRSADAMMYRSKAEGRNRLSVADSAVPAQFVSPKNSRHN